MPPTNSKKLHVGVLLLPPVQFLDVSPVDLFHMMSKQYLSECRMPMSMIELGFDQVRISYIGIDGPPSDDDEDDDNGNVAKATPCHAALTASASLLLTHNLSSKAVAPGKLDILMVPGPDPSSVVPEIMTSFVRAHMYSTGPRPTTVISVCTGIYILAHSGVLDGEEASGPRALISMDLEKKFPKVKWVKDRRWAIARGGRLWSSGGITNGQEMVAAYIRANFSRELADLVCTLADVGERNMMYDSSEMAATSWFVWILFRSWVRGLGGKMGLWS